MATNLNVPDPEVSAKATRRRFSGAEKARILDAYEVASDIEKAAICRRERVYSSLLSNWRKQRAAGNPLSLRRGPKANPGAAELTRLQKRNAVLERRLAKAEQVIEIQGKVYALLRTCVGESADQLDLPPWSTEAAATAKKILRARALAPKDREVLEVPRPRQVRRYLERRRHGAHRHER